MGNPFLEESCDLLVLDSQVIADSACVETVRNIEKIGQEQYSHFMKSRVIERTASLFEPIKRNNLPLFNKQQTASGSNPKETIKSLKSDCALFSKLFILEFLPVVSQASSIYTPGTLN